MSQGVGTAGLSLEQGPPIAVPLSFFLTAPFFVLGAGIWLLVFGQGALTHRLIPVTVILTHTLTLGFLAMVMCGALYQMLPVVAASPVPKVRSAYLVHGCLTSGTLCLLGGIYFSHKYILIAAYGLLGLFLVLFIVPIARALFPKQPAGAEESAALGARAGIVKVKLSSQPAHSTLLGMRWAVCALFVLGTVGIWLAHGYGGYSFPPGRIQVMQWHIGLALLLWVGGLITAVSWQVVPMFYLTDEIPSDQRRWLLWALGSGLVLPTFCLCLLLTGVLNSLPILSYWVVPVAFVPIAIGVWVYNPWLLSKAIRTRRRSLPDTSLGFWRLGLGCGPVCLVLAMVSMALDDPRWPLAFGWVCIWGWAGAILHGMLHRIVPFLVWFHRCVPLIGQVRVPSAKKLLPEKTARPALWLHVLTLLVGLLAVGLGGDVLGRLTGLLLAATGLYLAKNLVSVARYQPSGPGVEC